MTPLSSKSTIEVLPPLRRKERGVRVPKTPASQHLRTAKDFKMVTCTYNNKDRSLLLRGRTLEGKSLQVRLLNFKYYFYLQRQTPFSSGQDVVDCVQELERVAKGQSVFHVPQKGNIDEIEERNGLSEWVLRSDPRVAMVQRADHVYRTMYGYTPDNCYLEGLVRVYVPNYQYAKHLAMVTESEDWLDYLEETYGATHKRALRTFGVQESPETLFYTNHEIHPGAYCRLTDYRRDVKKVVYADEYLAADHRNLIKQPDPPSQVPLRILGFDIECVGKPDGRGGMTFPVAKSTERARADPVVMIAMAETRYGVEKGLDVHRGKVLVWKHPNAAPLIRKPEHRRMTRAEYDALPAKVRQTLPAVYGLVQIQEVYSEAHLLRAYVDTLHEWQSDVLTGWNTNQFDLPYLYNRWVELYKESAEARVILGTARPCLGMGVHAQSFARWQIKSSKASGSRSYEAVTLPHMLYADGQVVMENTSYGLPKMPSSRLDVFASTHLKYPGTDRPQRKIKFPLSESISIWETGGAGMWFFSCYCFVDALLPLQLLDKFDKVGLMFAIAAITYCDTNKIYNNGMQVKCIACIQRASKTYKDGVLLVPDSGTRHFHYPGLFEHVQLRRVLYTLYKELLRMPPEGVTSYLGAMVLTPKAGYYPGPVSTKDFKSLYPMSAQKFKLSYDTFLTPETIRKYNIKRHEYIVVPVGPKSLTFCGYETYDPVGAKEAGYTEDIVMISHWYQPRGSTFFGYIIDSLFTLRKDFRKIEAIWKQKAFLMKYHGGGTTTTTMNGEDSAAPARVPDMSDTDLCASIEQKYGSYFFERIVKALDGAPSSADGSPPAAWQSMVDGAWKMYEGHLVTIKNAYMYGNEQAAKYDIAQLAAKLTLNSLYGFTGISVKIAMLPMMALAAATTSIGRHVLALTKCTTQRVSAKTLREMFDTFLKQAEEDEGAEQDGVEQEGAEREVHVTTRDALALIQETLY